MNDNASLLLMRKAARQDVTEIVRLLSDDPLGSQREHYAAQIPDSYYQAFEAIDRDPNQELIVAELNGKVVGTFQLTYLMYLSYQGRKRMQIEAVRVDAPYRGQGLGAQMMAWAIERARQQSCYLIQLTSHKSRADAHRFYQRLGFRNSHEGMKLYLSE
jgi:GNAT superfamily N-acetyltransferase